MSKKGFTLIELLVVILIIAVLATIALPKYMIARDIAHLVALMIIGGDVNDSLNRASLTDEAGYYGPGLDKSDLVFKDYQGTDCTSTTCRITVSGKDYTIRPYLNYQGTHGRNLTYFYSYENMSFGAFAVYTETHNPDFTYRLNCYQASSHIAPDVDRCVKLGKSLGASNSACDTSLGSPNCTFN